MINKTESYTCSNTRGEHDEDHPTQQRSFFRTEAEMSQSTAIRLERHWAVSEFGIDVIVLRVPQTNTN